jgi:3-oxoacyl-[acyl-carrier protein] reductase
VPNQRGAVVTGGAGGIGLAVARRLAADGYDVVALDASEPAAEAARASIQPGQRCRFLTVDVRDTTVLHRSIAAAMRDMSVPSLLCACAGVKPPIDIHTIDAATWDDVFAVNVRGAFFAAQAALPYLMQNQGSLIFVGSASANGDYENPLYGASKGAVVALARSLASALAPHRVRVNVVVPGFTRTRMTDHLSADRIRAAGRRNVAGRVNEPEDVAAAVAWLASNEALTISNAVLDVGTAHGVPARYAPLGPAPGPALGPAPGTPAGGA